MYFDYKSVVLVGFLTIYFTTGFGHGKALLEKNTDSKGKPVYDHNRNIEGYQPPFIVRNNPYFPKERESNYYPLLSGQPIYIPNLAQSAAQSNKLLASYYKAFTDATTPTTPVQHRNDGKSKYYEHMVSSTGILKNDDGVNEGGHVDNFHVLPEMVHDLNSQEPNLHDSSEGYDAGEDYVTVVNRIKTKGHKYDLVTQKTKPKYEHTEDYEVPFIPKSVKNKMFDIPGKNSKLEALDEYAQPAIPEVLKKMLKEKAKKQSNDKLNSDYKASTMDGEYTYDLNSNGKSSSNFHKKYQMNKWPRIKYYDTNTVKITDKVVKSDQKENSLETDPGNDLEYETPQYKVKKIYKDNFADKNQEKIIKPDSKWQLEEHQYESPQLITNMGSARKTDKNVFVKLKSTEHPFEIREDQVETKFENSEDGFQHIKNDKKYTADSNKFEKNVPHSDVITSLTSLYPSIRSLIFNPNAESINLKKCITNKNEPGFCSYIQHCDVPKIADSLEQLLNNSCVIDEAYIGVCCPEFPAETIKVQWEQLSSHKQLKEEFSQNVKDCGIRSEESSRVQSWPWMAPLVSMSTGEIFCAGVLINEEYVLTAAHCTTKVGAENRIFVRLGQIDDSTGSDVAVVEIKRHARYDPRTTRNDIALLKLGQLIKHDDHVNFICLDDDDPDDDDDDDDDDNDDHEGEKAILLRWNSIFGTRSKDHEVLKVLSNEKCSRKLRENVPGTVLCTRPRKENKETCNADLGAPLIIEDDGKYEVIGILSWNKNDCDQRFPSVFTRVSNYVKWIRNHMN